MRPRRACVRAAPATDAESPCAPTCPHWRSNRPRRRSASFRERSGGSACCPRRCRGAGRADPRRSSGPVARDARQSVGQVGIEIERRRRSLELADGDLVKGYGMFDEMLVELLGYSDFARERAVAVQRTRIFDFARRCTVSASAARCFRTDRSRACRLQRGSWSRSGAWAVPPFRETIDYVSKVSAGWAMNTARTAEIVGVQSTSPVPQRPWDFRTARLVRW